MSGYIGATPVPQATQHREAFTATASQTSFATAGYTPQFLDVYLNGVKLAAADYTATNGSDIVLTTGAALDDILEYVAYTPFEVADQTFTGTTTVDVLTTTGAFTSLGIDDNATSTAITIDASENVLVGKTSANFATAGVQLQPATASSFTQDGVQPLSLNRLTSDGDILKLFKDGTTVGSIGAASGTLTIDGPGNNVGLYFAGNAIIPRDGGANTDGVNDLGGTANRWKNIYTSGAIYLGGTVSANALDDYEEGTWTPTASFGGASVGITYATQVGRYTKVGNLVTASCFISISNNGTSTGNFLLAGLPFPSSSTANVLNSASIRVNGVSFADFVQAYVSNNVSYALLHESTNAGAVTALDQTNVTNGSSIMFNVTYRV